MNQQLWRSTAWRWMCVFGLILSTTGGIVAAEKEAGARWLSVLEKEQRQANEELWAAQKDPANRDVVRLKELKAAHAAQSHERAQKVFAIEAEARPSDLGARAMELVLRDAPLEDQKQALRILTEHYALRSDARRFVGTAGVIEAPEAETFLRRVADQNEDLDSRGMALYCLGKNLELLAGRTENAEEAEQLRAEAEARYRRGITEFTKAGRPEEHTAQLLEGALNEIAHLKIGQPVPDIEGRDINDQPLRLSDYQGKVVALVFWATWCGPCMQMIPQERALVERMKGRPFALIGVNGDAEIEKVREAMTREKMTWPTFYEGLGPQGTIPMKWGVQGWPTTYVMDAKGIIRFKNVRGKKMDAAVEELLKELESAQR